MSCSAPTITVDGVTLPTSDFENAQELLNTVSDDGGDPTLDEYEENIASGNNSKGTTGIQLPSTPEGQPPVQTSLPTESPVPATETIIKPPPVLATVAVAETVWTPGDYTVQLSPNFTLGNFTIKTVFPYPLTDFNSTYTAQQRFTNLKALAVNVAEPLRAKFGQFNINSGIRNKTSTPPPGLSQHITGQAMDVQFAGWTYDRYWENAAWIKDNIAYDQFIFEHSSSTGLAWYHLSFNIAGNRSPSVRTKVMTMYRNHFDSGLKRYG